MEEKGIVLCPCEGNLTVRSSSCGILSISLTYRLANYTTKNGFDCRRTNIQIMRDADRPNIMTPTFRCLFKLSVKRNGSYSQEAAHSREASEEGVAYLVFPSTR